MRVAEGRLTQLRLLEDPRLRRLPLEAGSPISEVRTEEGDLHTIYVGLAQPVVDRTTFKLSFLLTDTSGIGNLRLPKLEVVGVRSENRRLAVSVESPLEFDPAVGPNSRCRLRRGSGVVGRIADRRAVFVRLGNRRRKAAIGIRSCRRATSHGTCRFILASRSSNPASNSRLPSSADGCMKHGLPI